MSDYGSEDNRDYEEAPELDNENSDVEGKMSEDVGVHNVVGNGFFSFKISRVFDQQNNYFYTSD